MTRQRAAIHDLAFGATARAMRKYYTGKGASIYTWTSDQHAQYGTRVIQITEREATYVLDAIFDNETDLDITIEEHTTDTAGYTDLVLGLFDLCGLKFSPRIRDIADQRLWRLPTTPTGTLAASLLRHDIRPQRFLDRWDDLLRGSATIRHGHNPASLLVARLQASARQNDLTKAIQEYGRVIKTISLVRYLHDEKHRRRILVQLNKGESLHALRRRIFFASLGQFQRRRPDDQDLQAQCLTLLTNAVVCWNTVYIAAALAHLAEIGEPVQNDVARRIVPNGCEHINFLGRYDFNAPTSPAGANSVHSDTETDAICPFADPTPCSTSSDCLRRSGLLHPVLDFIEGSILLGFWLRNSTTSSSSALRREASYTGWCRFGFLSRRSLGVSGQWPAFRSTSNMLVFSLWIRDSSTNSSVTRRRSSISDVAKTPSRPR